MLFSFGILFLRFILMCMSILPAWISVHHLCLVPTEARENTGSSGTWDVRELPCVCWVVKLGSLEKQSEHLSAEPSLQPSGKCLVLFFRRLIRMVKPEVHDGMLDSINYQRPHWGVKKTKQHQLKASIDNYHVQRACPGITHKKMDSTALNSMCPSTKNK